MSQSPSAARSKSLWEIFWCRNNLPSPLLQVVDHVCKEKLTYRLEQKCTTRNITQVIKNPCFNYYLVTTWWPHGDHIVTWVPWPPSSLKSWPSLPSSSPSSSSSLSSSSPSSSLPSSRSDWNVEHLQCRKIKSQVGVDQVGFLFHCFIVCVFKNEKHHWIWPSFFITRKTVCTDFFKEKNLIIRLLKKGNLKSTCVQLICFRNIEKTKIKS